MSVLLLFSLLAFAFSQDLHGPGYENKTRVEKVKMVWTRVIQNSQPLDWYSPLQLAELFVESMNTSFITRADDMPKQYIGGFFDRKKLVHTEGVAVLVRFKVDPNNFNYTGILRTGADSALLRFSLAAKPDIDPPASTPGIAIKCFRDKTTSGNIFAMYDLLGQKTHNFFAHDLSNHPPDFGSWAPLALRTLKARFATASSWPNMIGLSNLASYDQDGKFYAQPNFPYRLIFHPTTQLHTSMPDKYTAPFYTHLSKVVTANQLLYTVFVQDQPNGPLVPFGTVTSVSTPTTTQFGDKTLFYQHTTMESDFAFKPQWKAAAEKERDMQRGTGAPGYHHPDLPWN